jgi:hypothetical protein
MNDVPKMMPAFAALSSSDDPTECINEFLECISSGKPSMLDDLRELTVVIARADTNRNRPYDGQPHTFTGQRGRQLLNGINMRDIADCLVKAFGSACNDQLTEEAYRRVENDQFTYQELYDLDLNKSDPVAIIQNLIVEIEKRMNIYPNVPELHVIEQ